MVPAQSRAEDADFAVLDHTGAPALFTRDAAVVASMAGIAPLLWLALALHPTTMCMEGLLLGGRQMRYLASAYLVNILVFLSSLYAIASNALGLGRVWSALAAFQVVRLVQFAVRARQIGLVTPGLRRPAAA